MKIDIQTNIDEYVSLLERIREKFGDDTDAMVILQEIKKDIRMKHIQQERSFNGDFPATEKQLGYLKQLGAEIPEGLAKREASRLIDQAKAKRNNNGADVEIPVRIP